MSTACDKSGNHFNSYNFHRTGICTCFWNKGRSSSSAKMCTSMWACESRDADLIMMRVSSSRSPQATTARWTVSRVGEVYRFPFLLAALVLHTISVHTGDQSLTHMYKRMWKQIFSSSYICFVFSLTWKPPSWKNTIICTKVWMMSYYMYLILTLVPYKFYWVVQRANLTVQFYKHMKSTNLYKIQAFICNHTPCAIDIQGWTKWPN